MQEIGVWVTEAGTVEAILETTSDGGDEWSMPAWASGALQGAAAGAMTGAAAGPYGALIGAAAGGAIGAATSAASPPAAPASAQAPASKPGAAKPAAKPAPKPTGDAGRAQAVQALQQFAAVVPVLVQLIAAGGGGKEVGTGDGAELTESFEADEWGPESFEGTWTQP
jgi:hypothetical protein